MNITTEKTLSDPFQDLTKASHITRNYSLNFNMHSRKNLNYNEYKSGHRIEKISNDPKIIKGKSKDYLKINDWSLDFLCDFIVINHHNYIRKVMPKILSAVKFISGKKYEEFNLYIDLTRLNYDFEYHMQREEKLLFPYIKIMNNIPESGAQYEIPPFGLILNLIRVIEKEHCKAVKSLSKISKSCRSLKPGKNDQIRKKLLNEFISEFERDFHFHIQLENNILFPKAVSLEKKLKKNIKTLNHK